MERVHFAMTRKAQEVTLERAAKTCENYFTEGAENLSMMQLISTPGVPVTPVSDKGRKYLIDVAFCHQVGRRFSKKNHSSNCLVSSKL